MEQALDAASRPPYFEGGRWAVLISFVALLFSGISLYETILKQPRPVLHVGGIMHYARDPVSGADVFAVPVTIANQGARDAVITMLDLRIASDKAAATAPVSFVSAYVGGNPAKENQPFTPLAISGRNAYTGVVLFYPTDLKSGAAKGMVEGEARYHFCLGVRTEPTRDYPFLDTWLGAVPQAIGFDAELQWFSMPELLSGKTIPMQIKNVQRLEPRRDGERTGFACD